MAWIRSNGALCAVAMVVTLAACGGDEPPESPHANATSAATGAGGSGGSGGSGVSSSSSSASGGTGGADPCATRTGEYQVMLDDARQEAGSRGAVLAIATEECGLWQGASGESTAREPMKPEHVLRIGSVTKTFVATVILELVDEGSLALDDKLSQYVANFPGGDGITLRQLLNHSSGIFSYTDGDFFDAALADPMKVWSPEELLAYATSEPPYFAPGEGWHYSNTNYILLGMIVEMVTGKAVGAVIRERLLDKVPLAATSFDGEEPIVGELGHGYSSDIDVSTYFDPSWAWTAGAMVASAGDLALWARALYGGAVLPPASLDAMLTTVETDTPSIDYGLGVMVLDPSVAIETTVGHGGDIPGYHTHMFYVPSKKLSFAAIVNEDGASPNPISAAVLKHFLQ